MYHIQLSDEILCLSSTLNFKDLTLYTLEVIVFSIAVVLARIFRGIWFSSVTYDIIQERRDISILDA